MSQSGTPDSYCAADIDSFYSRPLDVSESGAPDTCCAARPRSSFTGSQMSLKAERLIHTVPHSLAVSIPVPQMSLNEERLVHAVLQSR